MKKIDIKPTDSNGKFHGYQEWYWTGKVVLRGNYIHGNCIGYRENHNMKSTNFFIR